SPGWYWADEREAQLEGRNSLGLWVRRQRSSGCQTRWRVSRIDLLCAANPGITECWSRRVEAQGARAKTAIICFERTPAGPRLQCGRAILRRELHGLENTSPLPHMLVLFLRLPAALKKHDWRGL